MLRLGLAFAPLSWGLVDSMADHIQLMHEKHLAGIDRVIPSSVWLFHPDNDADVAFKSAYNVLAEDLKENLKIVGVNCQDNPKVCASHSYKAGQTTPHVMIYPPNPMSPYQFKGDLSGTARLKKHLVTLLPQNGITILTKETIDEFLTSEASKPKVILFSKSKPNHVAYGLGVETVFRRTIKFGFVSIADEGAKDMLSKFKGLVSESKLPAAVRVSGQRAEKKEKFKGDKFNFIGLKEWINTFSESGMGDKTRVAGGQEEQTMEEARPWLTQEVPEFTQASHHDVCMKGEGLCVIYLTQGPLEKESETMLMGLKTRYTSSLGGRGTVLKWMWMDLTMEPDFKEMFNAPGLPGVAVLNPHKRKRYTISEAENVQQKEIGELLDKILGGDARFKVVKGQKLPWAKRSKADKKQEL